MGKVLDGFAALAERERYGVHAAAVMQHGVFLEEYRVTSDEPHPLYSVSKSFTSLAVGMLMDEGRLSAEDTVISFFPSLAPRATSEALRALRVRHLLCMAAGRDHPPLIKELYRLCPDGDWISFYLSLPFDRMPGGRFSYDSGCTYLLSAIVEEISGQTLLEFLTPRLFEPLGIRQPVWDSCPRGHTLGGIGLYLRTRELLSFGQLCLQRGQYGGKQLVSPAYIARAASRCIATPAKGPTDTRWGYGCQFWRCHNGAYRADGAYGQFCIVDKKNDAVIAVNAHSDRPQAILDAVWEQVTPQLKEG